MNDQLEIFFPTRDRDESLAKCLDSIIKFCPGCKLTIGNCSTNQLETSKVLQNYEVNEIMIPHNTGIAESFQILIQKLSRKYCLWLSDDLVLLKNLDEIYREIESNVELKIFGLPMKDIIHFEDRKYPVDEFGCAVIDLNGIRGPGFKHLRFGHFCFTERDLLTSLSPRLNSKNQIDYAVASVLVTDRNYKFIKGEPFILHDRLMDSTRKNRIK